MRRTTMRDEVIPMLPPRARDPYIAWRPPFPEPPFERGHTALLVVDMQYLDAHWDYSMCRKIRDAGFERELLYYKDRLDLIVPNIRRLQNAFRTAGLEVMHARIQSMTGDGRDRGPSHKRLGHFAPPQSRPLAQSSAARTLNTSCATWRSGRSS